MFRISRIALLLAAWGAAPLTGAEVLLVRQKPDPYGSPRPAVDAVHVPVRTSLYFELELKDAASDDRIQPRSVSVSLQAEGEVADTILRPDLHFTGDAKGWVRARGNQGGVTVYIDPGQQLKPATRYRIDVSAQSHTGAQLAGPKAAWSFTTETAAQDRPLEFEVDLDAKPVHWQGGFFTGICNVVFCTQDSSFGPLYRMMTDAQKDHPRAWRYQRDIWMTATDDRKEDWHLLMDPKVPNFVRERETRRITSLEDHADGLLLHLEDFYGCQQYGVAPGRPLSEDYQPGYEILVADGVDHAQAKVLAVDDKAKTILVAKVPTPKQGWRIDYQAPPPTQENPDAPGLFAAGGTHLRRFHPSGTPVYYWGRLDKEWDLAVKTGGRRLVVNFVEAPSDLSLTAKPYTRPKDYVQWHDVVRTTTGHLIDRYGDASLDFAWSVFNEPDIVGDYWRFHWDEAQRFYDYTVDGVLRAFEDRGYDSRRVQVGGWELGAIFGENLRLNEVLAHCSPRAEAQANGMLPQNAAFTDAQLDGKRSRRVEELCRPANGKGSPCDFLSIHTYNRSDVAASKLIRAKEMALAMDADFYRNLWINTHESCPSWSPPPDDGAADSYLGNGYFPSWCFDVAQRQLHRASEDERYAFGDSVITIWPPPQGFSGLNALSRHLPVDNDGDGRSDASTSVAAPVFHALTLLSDFGPDFWPLSSQSVAGHTVSGFASRHESGALLVAIFSHHPEDIQSRSDQSFQIKLRLKPVNDARTVKVTAHRFDRDHNTYFAEAVAQRNQAAKVTDPQEVERLTRVLESGDPAALREAFPRIEKLDSASLAALGPAFLQMLSTLTEPELRAAAQDVLRGVFTAVAGAQPGMSSATIAKVKNLATLSPSSESTVMADADGLVELSVALQSNGVQVLRLEPSGN